jgi:hypothetical protein
MNADSFLAKIAQALSENRLEAMKAACKSIFPQRCPA